ncbi:hypothetical protein D3C76_1474350 [compost metagenome]
MLAAFEAPGNLPLPTFARLAGKSRDQLNRDIKARRLLSVSLGNRGQRIPEWQLDPLKLKLVLSVFEALPAIETWDVYRMLSNPNGKLRGNAPCNAVTHDNFEELVSLLTSMR